MAVSDAYNFAILAAWRKSSPESFSAAAFKQNSLEASIRVAISASLNWIIWWFIISVPKALRSLAYWSDLSYAPLAIPRACAAIPIRPPLSTFIANLNPNPSSPILFAFGTFTSWNIKECVSLPLIPSLSSFLPTIKPSISEVTIRQLIPLCPFSTSVWAITRNVLPVLPLVIQFLVPFKR